MPALTPSEVSMLQSRITTAMIETAQRYCSPDASEFQIALTLHNADFTADEIARGWPAIESHFIGLMGARQ